MALIWNFLGAGEAPCIENKGVKRSCIGLRFTVMLNSHTVGDVTNAAYPMCFDGFDGYQVGM